MQRHIEHRRVVVEVGHEGRPRGASVLLLLPEGSDDYTPRTNSARGAPLPPVSSEMGASSKDAIEPMGDLVPTNMRNVLALPGYTNQSVWGYDESLQSYFATIWADTSSGDEEPDIWIMGMPAISSEVELAAIIAWKVDVEPADVLSSMHLWDGVEGKVVEGSRGAWWHKLFGR